MTARLEQRLFVWQRVSAMLLAVMVLAHLGVIFYASHGGLSAGEILARTRGNIAWAGFYTAFVLAASVHAPIGLRNVLHEWTRLPRALVDWGALVFALALLLLGLRSVAAVYV